MKSFDDYDFSVNLNLSYKELDFYKKDISDKLEEAEKNNREICFCKYCNQYYSREKTYKEDMTLVMNNVFYFYNICPLCGFKKLRKKINADKIQ